MQSSESNRKMGLAMMVACPACAGGLVFAIGTALGAGAVAVKGGLALAGLSVVMAFWARNIWRRRGETAT